MNVELRPVEPLLEYILDLIRNKNHDVLTHLLVTTIEDGTNREIKDQFLGWIGPSHPDYPSVDQYAEDFRNCAQAASLIYDLTNLRTPQSPNP